MLVEGCMRTFLIAYTTLDRRRISFIFNFISFLMSCFTVFLICFICFKCIYIVMIVSFFYHMQ